MQTIFDVTAYRKAADSLSAQDINAVDNLNSRFKEIQIPISVLHNRRSRTSSNCVRACQSTWTAWTWSEEFDLQQRFSDLRDALSEYGFSDVGADANLILRCASAVLKEDPSAEALTSLSGTEVRTNFPRVENGIHGAVDFLRTQLHVESLSTLPYPALLVPLSVFFAEPEGQVRYDAATYERIKRWFWRACFSGRYGGQTIRSARDDIKQMHLVKDSQESTLGDFTHGIDAELFMTQVFRINGAISKTFVPMLAQERPLTFLSGAEVAVGAVLQNYNRSEFPIQRDV
jgi:hypothetical protein